MSAENNNPAPGRPWQPGQSGNPGGRPKGLAKVVRERAPADKLVDYFVAVWQADTTKLAELGISPADVTLKARNDAALWLSERGYGKAVPYAPIESDDPLELTELDRAVAEARDELARVRSRRETDRGTGAEADDPVVGAG